MDYLNQDSLTHTFRDESFGSYMVKEDFLSADFLNKLDGELRWFLENHPDRCSDDRNVRKRIVMGTQEWAFFLKYSPHWSRFDKFLNSEVFLSWWVKEMSGLFEEEYPELARGIFRFLTSSEKFAQKLSRKLFPKRSRESFHLEADLSFAREGYEVGPHHDNERKRLVGLLYLGTFPNLVKQENSGGDLLLLAYKSNAIAKEKLRRREEHVDDRFREIVRVTPDRNKACFFVNTTSAIHAVTTYRNRENLRVFLYISVCARDKNIQSLQVGER